MRCRFRTLVILLAVAAYITVITYCATPVLEGTSEYLFNRIAWVMYRGRCGATFD